MRCDHHYIASNYRAQKILNSIIIIKSFQCSMYCVTTISSHFIIRAIYLLEQETKVGRS